MTSELEQRHRVTSGGCREGWKAGVERCVASDGKLMWRARHRNWCEGPDI